MAQRARDAGLPVVLVGGAAERLGRAQPTRLKVSAALTRTVRERRVDLVHAYEYSVALDALFGPTLRLGVPLVTTIYGMTVPRWLPRGCEVIVGTRELVDHVAAFREPPTLIEPPVNTDVDDPAAVDGRAFRKAYGIADDEILIAIVSRLEPDMKQEGVVRSIQALAALNDPRLRLVVVGDGPSYQHIAQEAAKANALLGSQAVVLTGSMTDPRPAYAAADIALGMGGSALRAMAFGRPLIVLGIKGFSRACTPDTIDYFLHAGFYGIGDGDQSVEPLVHQLQEVIANPRLRQERGEWSRALVLDRFSLKRAAHTLAEVYERAMSRRATLAGRLGDAARVAVHKTVADLTPPSARRRIRRLLG